MPHIYRAEDDRDTKVIFTETDQHWCSELMFS